MSTYSKVLSVAVVIALITLFLWDGCSDPIQVNAPVITHTKVIRNQALSIDSSYKLKYDSTVALSIIKENQIAAQKKELKQLQAQARQMESFITELINQEPVSSEYSDSVKTAVKDLVANSVERDSACNATIDQLDSLVALKAGQVDDARNYSKNLNRVLQKTLDEHMALSNYSTQLERQIKKGKRGKNIWKTAAILLAGAFTINSLTK